MILISYFEPFEGRPENSSELVADLLKKSVVGQFLRLPVSFQRAWPLLETAIQRYDPKLVICLGQAESRPHIFLERQALNWVEFHRKDNDGENPAGMIDPLWPEPGIATRVDVQPLVRQLNSPEVVASNSAGAYVCNHLYFRLLQKYHGPGLFVHLPLTQVQGGDKPATHWAHHLEDIIQWLKKNLSC